jgi:hypothetical protein
MAGSGAVRGSAWWGTMQDPGRRPRPVVIRRNAPSYPGEGCGGRVILRRCGRQRGCPRRFRIRHLRRRVLPGGGRWVLYASPSRWLTVVAYFGVGGGGGRLVDGSMVDGGLILRR